MFFKTLNLRSTGVVSNHIKHTMAPKTNEMDLDTLFIIVLTALKINDAHPNTPCNKKKLLQFFTMYGL